MCDIPDIPDITEKKYKPYDFVVKSLARDLCEIFDINPIARESFADFVASSLNQEKGHPARIMLLTMIFHSIENMMMDGNDEKHTMH
jgi:hypothetical protein